MTFTISKPKVQLCPPVFTQELQKIDRETLDIPESLQCQIRDYLLKLSRAKPEIDAIQNYSVSHSQQTFLLIDKLYVRWWGVSPDRYHEHLYFCTPIQGAPPNANGVWYESVGFSPWSGKLHIPEDGYTLEQTFQIFLQKEAAFTWEDTKKLKYSDLDAAIMQYACMASRNPKLKLLVNTKKGIQYVIGNTGGCPVFSSFDDMNKFFYGDDDPDDGESLNNLIEMFRQKIYARMGTLPNGSVFKKVAP